MVITGVSTSDSVSFLRSCGHYCPPSEDGPKVLQSSQKPLNRSGVSSVYRTVCMMFLWPR